MNRQSFLIASVLFTVAPASQASTLITFDDINAPGNSGPIPDAYKDLSWTNLGYADPFHHGGDWANSGAGTGIV